MRRYNKLYEAKSVQYVHGIWYHGDLNRRLSFADQKMQSVNFNAVGPGIYFTSDKDQAIGYAGPNGYLYACDITGNFVTDNKKATLKEIRSFLALLSEEQREILLSNYDENPVKAQRELERMNVNTNFVECFADLGVVTDYRSLGVVWASLMVKLGYSGVLHKPNAKYSPTLHLVVWDSSVITVLQEDEVTNLP